MIMMALSSNIKGDLLQLSKKITKETKHRGFLFSPYTINIMKKMITKSIFKILYLH